MSSLCLVYIYTMHATPLVGWYVNLCLVYIYTIFATLLPRCIWCTYIPYMLPCSQDVCESIYSTCYPAPRTYVNPYTLHATPQATRARRTRRSWTKRWRGSTSSPRPAHQPPSLHNQHRPLLHNPHLPHHHRPRQQYTRHNHHPHHPPHLHLHRPRPRHPQHLYHLNHHHRPRPRQVSLCRRM